MITDTVKMRLTYIKDEDGVCREKSTSFCCDKMREAYVDGAVFFGDYEATWNKDSNLNIGKCSVYPEGAFWDEYPISFCPFCSASVVCVGHLESL